MIRSYLKLVIIFAVNHQVFLLAGSMENRFNANKKAILKAVAEVLRTTDAPDDNNNNYQIVLRPSLLTATNSVTKPNFRKHTSKPAYREHLNSYKPVLRQGLNLNKPVLRSSLIQPIFKQKHHHLYRPGEIKDFNKTREKRLRRRKTIETINTQNLEDKIKITDTKDGWAWIQNDKPKLVTTTVRNQFEKVRTDQNVTSLLLSRRINYLDDVQRHRPQRWVQCMDFITPRLKGYSENWKRKQINSTNGDIRRLVHLLALNTTEHTMEEIVALLLEMSNIRFRIFQWHYSAITLLLNVIIRGPNHSFRALKRGIKRIFERWHLDTSNMKIFLEQTRIFRPPCINITGNLEYTKRPGGAFLFTKPDKPTKKPRDSTKSCESRERKNKNKWN